ncbi:MAG: NERD domain-containing protein [Peptostreptococcaceae bacterium]|nr:NERD domain-containing protein [Peptostreptococcaceae bacterium]
MYKSIIVLLIMIALKEFLGYKEYKKSKYSEASGNAYGQVRFNKGNYGEYDTFRLLEKFNIYKKLLTNIYLPTKDGGMTEVDLVMISKKGIFVFESKNYSGWIYGDDRHKTWTQTFKNGKKEKFFNPIWQNNGHITNIKRALNIEDDELFKSYIVFSQRCTLKKISNKSKDTFVGYRGGMIKGIYRKLNKMPDLITIEEVKKIYKQLDRYTNVSNDIKLKHIQGIKTKIEK